MDTTDPISALSDGPPYLSRMEWHCERARNIVALQIEISAIEAKREIKRMGEFARRSMGQKLRINKRKEGTK